MTQDNNPLGSTYGIDASGIPNMNAGTVHRRSNQTIITHEKGRLSLDEIDRMVQKA